MKTITRTIIFLLLANVAVAQDYFETNTFGASSIDILINSAVDSNGNIYSAGLYSGTLTVGSESTTWQGGNADAFLSFHNENGTPTGIQGFGGQLDDAAIDVAVDANDNIFITGYFQGAGPNAFDADPGPNEFLLEQLSPIASRDCFIIKLDSNRDFVNAWQISNPSGAGANEDSHTIEVDSDGNIYVAGSFAFADFDPDPSDEETILSVDGGSTTDGFLVKLDNNGDFIWVKTYDGANGHVRVDDMQFDADGNLVLVGSFENEVDLDTDGTNTDIFSTNGDDDIFITKVDTGGNYIWGAAFGGAGLDIAETVSILSSGIYLGGMFSGTVDFDPGASTNEVTSNGDWDAFYSVFDTNGNFQSAYITGGEGNENLEAIYSIVEDADGQIYAAGEFIGTSDFDLGSGTEETTSNGNVDLFYVINNTAGEYVNHWTVGGSQAETNPQIRFNTNGDIITNGSYRSSDMDFNPFSGVDTQGNNGFFDVFFSRYALETLGVNENELNEVVVYPNPFVNEISIANSELIESYQVYSVTGKLLQEGIYNKSINLSSISKGVYLLTLKGNRQTTTKRIVKH
ncbi:T9SS type A sorting domain-containing protein [Patiriisocius hiemis]|uniref:T9SS type A sorting domain-containing protein n=1 Tax=Patiriisocius hiemis TaxID=3075604 RepID=A0ABU2YCG2_9FLAO|nr:T9SS type A sorting domain-containing protein [Constantimarinum sp. W242]MDT0555344.1 T9SS type A sorting domain-containing protein [Constantimarinum sp. W242]